MLIDYFEYPFLCNFIVFYPNEDFKIRHYTTVRRYRIKKPNIFH